MRFVTEFFKETGRQTSIVVGSTAIGIGITEAAIATGNLVSDAINKQPMPDPETFRDIVMRLD